MIEPSFRALLMSTIRQSPLLLTGLMPAGETAIALSMIAAGANEEKGAAFTGATKPLPENHFVSFRHASPQAVLDNGIGFVAG
jgi:ERCC4-related helicase